MAQRAMLTHADIWNAVDRLAARAGLSASGLAKKAGLDPTTFNKSKRITPEGRPRWPSTESIAKSLQATGVTLDSFVALISDRARLGPGGAADRADRRRAPAAISTTAAFRPARAGTRSRFRR